MAPPDREYICSNCAACSPSTTARMRFGWKYTSKPTITIGIANNAVASHT
jgi:hypothetical protein